MKVDSLFKIETVKLERAVKASLMPIGTLGPELLGSLPYFALGSERLDTDDADVTMVFHRVVERWTEGRASGKSGVLMIVGSTDRVRLDTGTRERFEANTGLARARAETVRAHLMQLMKSVPADVRLHEDQMLILVSGPRRTPGVQTKSRNERSVGFPEDRRVDIWAFWSVVQGISPAR